MTCRGGTGIPWKEMIWHLFGGPGGGWKGGSGGGRLHREQGRTLGEEVQEERGKQGEPIDNLHWGHRESDTLEGNDMALGGWRGESGGGRSHREEGRTLGEDELRRSLILHFIWRRRKITAQVQRLQPHIPPVLQCSNKPR